MFAFPQMPKVQPNPQTANRDRQRKKANQFQSHIYKTAESGCRLTWITYSREICNRGVTKHAVKRLFG
jgi:hypothetical protein